MPMTTEVCATCGCNEFAHHWDEETEETECECGSCGDYVWMDEPGEILCICGCPDHAHDGAPGPCRDCGECDRYAEYGPAYEALRELVGYYSGRSGTRAEDPRRARRSDANTLIVDWLDEPVRITATMIDDDEGSVRRVNRPPEPDETPLIYLAVTGDGLEIAVSADEVVT